MKKLIRKIAALFGIQLLSNYEVERQRKYQELLEKFAQQRAEKKPYSKTSASLIVFSKDRALQLESLLRSYFLYVKNPIPITVLYYASATNFKQGYQKLISAYSENTIEFIEESNFRSDLQAVFQKIAVAKVLFLVDDIFFKEAVDFDIFLTIDPSKYVASLRMGQHLSYAYTVQKQQGLPEFESDGTHTDMISWSWENGEHDWRYPLSVDGHLFDAEEIRILINELDYKAPNSLEAALQIMHPLFSKRKGLCYPKAIIVNNPCNIVQTEHGNFHGETSIEELNEKWLAGERIAVENYKGLLNKSVHEDISLSFVKDE